jgi:hypothetical protein
MSVFAITVILWFEGKNNAGEASALPSVELSRERPDDDAGRQAALDRGGISLAPSPQAPHYRRAMAYRKCFLAALVAVLFIAGIRPSQVDAETPVALELLLAVDSSSSVDADEFELQMTGLAEAFRDPGVLAAMEQTWPRGIAVALLQWSQESEQFEALDWTLIRSAADAQAFAKALDQTPRYVGGGATAVGTAIATGADWIESNAFAGERKVIDVSGDGQANEGIPAAVGRAGAMKRGIVVNGLAILNEEPKLARYYLAGVVGGPGSFLLTADDFNDFKRAIRRKIYFEIAGPPVADASDILTPDGDRNELEVGCQSVSQSAKNPDSHLSSAASKRAQSANCRSAG